MTSTNLFGLLLLLAAAQSLFLAVLITHKHRRLFANRFLITLLVLYSALLLNLLLGDLGYTMDHPRLLLTLLGIGLIPGPLHYMYARHLANPGLRFKGWDWLHFVPLVLYEVLIWGYYRLPGQSGFPAGSAQMLDTATTLYSLYHVCILLQFAFYLILTLRILKRYAHRLQNIFSTLDHIRLTWLRNITWLSLVFIGTYAVELGLLTMDIRLAGDFGITSVLMAIYVYALGYLGLFKSEVLSSEELRRPLRDSSNDATTAPAPKYQKSGLDPQRSQQIRTQLQGIMDNDAPYTNSSLTLNQLASALDISAHNLSEVINSELGKNFFDYINGYRVQCVQRDLLDPKKSHLTVLSLALDAGFNSKSSFNSIFKKTTGMTPSQYRKAQS
jgi:AraC-like DNA-binding protein